MQEILYFVPYLKKCFILLYETFPMKLFYRWHYILRKSFNCLSLYCFRLISFQRHHQQTTGCDAVGGENNAYSLDRDAIIH